ncbi:MAG: cation:proton antiporter [Vicinamibacterales bacterium]
MDPLNLSLAFVGLVVLSVGLLSNAVKQSAVSEPLVAVAAGVLAGPYGLAWIDVRDWHALHTLMEQLARVTLAVSLLEVAMRLRPRSLRVMWPQAAVLLTLGMAGMWLVSSALAAWVLGLSFWTALLLGAIVTPTDPVVASSIVTGRFAATHLPVRVRDLLSMESGANDGLAYVFVMLSLLALEHAGVPLGTWLLRSVLWSVAGGIAAGAAVGYTAARLLQAAERRGVIADTLLRAYTVAFALFTLGFAALLQTDAIVAVFFAGLAFNLRARHEAEREEGIQEPESKLFTLPMFVLFGVALPLNAWFEFGWPLAGLVVLVLLLRRPPVVMALFPALRSTVAWRDAEYVAWFGPIGIAAVYYAAFAWGHLGDPRYWQITSAIVCGSVLVHGITSAPLTRLYARHRPPPPVAAKAVDAPA